MSLLTGDWGYGERYEQAKEARRRNPAKRDQHLRECKERSERVLENIRNNRANLKDEEYDDLCQHMDDLDNESVGVEGVDY